MTTNTKSKHIISFRRIVALAGLLFLIILGMLHPIGAQSFTQGYNSDDQLHKGLIVMPKEGDPSKVTVATQAKADKVLGIVVDANDTPVTLTTPNQKVFVATQGQFQVLVSDEAGVVKPGDYIAISSINGIGMKATKDQPIAIGKALSGFDGKTDVITSQKVGDKSHNIGIVTGDVAIAHNPLAVPEKNSVPKILQATSEYIARKPVSAPRMYLSAIVLFFSMAIAGAMFYTGVRSGITAVGRNPLSKKDIVRSMFQVILTSMIVFIIGLFGVYLLLKL